MKPIKKYFFLKNEPKNRNYGLTQHSGSGLEISLYTSSERALHPPPHSLAHAHVLHFPVIIVSLERYFLKTGDVSHIFWRGFSLMLPAGSSMYAQGVTVPSGWTAHSVRATPQPSKTFLGSSDFGDPIGTSSASREMNSMSVSILSLRSKNAESMLCHCSGEGVLSP